MTYSEKYLFQVAVKKLVLEPARVSNWQQRKLDKKGMKGKNRIKKGTGIGRVQTAVKLFAIL